MGRVGRAKEHSVGSGGAGDESGVVSVMVEGGERCARRVEK